jgi:hypothetical protein
MQLHAPHLVFREARKQARVVGLAKPREAFAIRIRDAERDQVSKWIALLLQPVGVDLVTDHIIRTFDGSPFELRVPDIRSFDRARWWCEMPLRQLLQHILARVKFFNLVVIAEPIAELATGRRALERFDIRR